MHCFIQVIRTQRKKKEERIAQQGFFDPPFRFVNIYIQNRTRVQKL